MNNIDDIENDSEEFLTFEFIEDENSYEVVNCDKSAIVIKIPSKYKGLPVISIGSSAFYGCESLTSVIIPNSVTSIGKEVFEDCPSIESIIVEEGNSVYHSSNNCLIETKTKKLIVGCKNSIIPADGSVETICKGAFSGCSSLSSILIPDSVKFIEDYAFSGCTSLPSIAIPNSVISIGKGVFKDCSSTESIIVEEGNSVYHSSNNCLIETKTKKLIVGCKNSIIPADGSVETICNGAFSGCSSLSSILIPDSVKFIEDYAFSGCTSLPSITIPNSVTEIGYCAFHNCNSLTSIKIPSSVIYIADKAFEGCDSLASITIHDNVASIGKEVFEDCPSIESIIVEEGNSVYHSSNNCLIETKTKKLIVGCKNSIIPADGSVETICKGAFSGCSSLSSILIPDSVKSIEDYSFYACTSLLSITIPNSVISIGEGVFFQCFSFQYISIPGRFWHIRNQIFSREIFDDDSECKYFEIT